MQLFSEREILGQNWPFTAGLLKLLGAGVKLKKALLQSLMSKETILL